MDALHLLLLDGRAPAGAHAHSATMEAAVTAGFIVTLADVEAFCRGRLRTSARVSAAFAAYACAQWGTATRRDWAELDAEFDARTPSEALRTASRQLGGGLRRMLVAMFPAVQLPWTRSPAPHHPIVLGAAVAITGGTPSLAAEAAALAAVTSPASAAVRLLGLDPLAVHGMLARLVAEPGALPAVADVRSSADLPADGAPALDLLADVHSHAEVRLFAS